MLGVEHKAIPQMRGMETTQNTNGFSLLRRFKIFANENQRRCANPSFRLEDRYCQEEEQDREEQAQKLEDDEDDYDEEESDDETRDGYESLCL